MENLQISKRLMSSKQIAERTGKRHDHVIRDIRNMIIELDSPHLGDDDYKIIKDSREYDSEILLNERLSLCLASGYSVALRMAIIDDWARLKITVLIPETYGQALIEAGRLALELESKNLLIEKMQPKVDFYDTVTDSKDAIDLGTASKVLAMGYGRTILFRKLREKGILMKNNIPYQDGIDKGWFRLIETSWSKPNGDSHVYFKTLVFQKGLDEIRKLLSEK